MENLFRNWNEVEMSIMGEIITTSGLSEAILEDLNTPIGLSIVEKLTRIRNKPVFAEVILEVLKGSIELVILEIHVWSWNVVEMLIIGKIITTSGFLEVILEVLKGPIGVLARLKRWLGIEIRLKC